MAAPGALTPSGDSWVGEWSVHALNAGLSASEVASWVASALSGTSGWAEVGISFDEVASGDGVVFRSVVDLPGNAIGTCYYDVFPPRIDLKASYFGNMDLVSHEALHAFCFATHSPEGSVSILEPLEDPGEEGFSASDVAQVAAWLAGAPDIPSEGDLGGLAPGLYWHPADSQGYKTKWDLTDVSTVRITVPVTEALAAGSEPAATLAAVYSTDKDAPIEDWLALGASVEISGAGMLDSGWQSIPAEAKADVYVAVTLDVALPLHTFEAGAADVRAR